MSSTRAALHSFLTAAAVALYFTSMFLPGLTGIWGIWLFFIGLLYCWMGPVALLTAPFDSHLNLIAAFGLLSWWANPFFFQALLTPHRLKGMVLAWLALFLGLGFSTSETSQPQIGYYVWLASLGLATASRTLLFMGPETAADAELDYQERLDPAWLDQSRPESISSAIRAPSPRVSDCHIRRPEG